MSVSAELLDRVFGPGPGGTTEERARTSGRRFVRGLDQLTVDDRPEAKGRRLTASEALAAYGWDILVEATEEGSALISERPDAPGQALRARREQLGLSVREVAHRADVPATTVDALEGSRRRPIREYERIARLLGLDERQLSFRAEPAGNDRLAVRLRTLSDAGGALTSGTVAALAEAAWVVMTQARLEDALNVPRPALPPKEPSYGPPAYKIGYSLADGVREALQLADRPIDSMRDLVEQRYGVAVIQTRMNQRIAGATLEAGGRRAIVLNLNGRNENVYVRRSTLAHELGHLLFDPAGELRELRVDEYDALEQRPDQLVEPVEQRANAFAVQLLAPQRSAVDLYTASGDDRFWVVMDHFGISFTAGRFQVWNGMGRTVPLESIDTQRREQDPAWRGREEYTVSYHPLRSLLDHPARAGRFSALVVRAAEAGVISYDTAGEWLVSTEREVSDAAPGIRGLYPEVFGG